MTKTIENTTTSIKKKRKKKPPVVRAYRLQHKANAGKVARVAAVLPEYQKAAKIIQAHQLQAFVQDGAGFWNRRDPGEFETKLSERYKRSVQNQVVAGLDSWLELSKQEIRQIIAHSELPDETKADLWWLNACNAHYAKEATVPVWIYPDDVRTGSGERRSAPPETLSLLRAIMKHVRRHRVHVPQLWRSRTMALDGTVAQVTPTQGSMYELWVRVSTLDAGHPVWIPLKKNQFFNDAPGELSNFAQVTVSRDGALKVTLVKRSNRAAPVLIGEDISLDWGLNSMFASDLGDQLGRQFYPWLRKVDVQLTKLTVELQRRGIKPKTNARYRKFNQRIREYVRNEVGRILNRLVKRYGIKSITVETLDFRNGDLSKKMNRILIRAGRAAVKERLKSMSETQGIEIHEVNPAHTSRECSGCWFVSKQNRKGPHFVCGFCHKRLNADTNGSRTISMRRSHGLQYPYASRQTVLQRLDARFEARWGLKPGEAEKLRLAKERRKTTPCHSRANLSLEHPGIGNEISSMPLLLADKHQ